MQALFHQDAIVVPLGSGSRGNSTYVGDGRRGVLVDCGISTRQIFERLDSAGVGDTTIDAVMVTHEHLDHVGAARILDDRIYKKWGRRIPFFMTRGTLVGVPERCRPTRVERISSGVPFRVSDHRSWTVEPYTIPHDTQDPVAYTLCIGELRVGVITDLGRSTRVVERHLASLDVAVLEFNHDVQMLMDGEYPWRLKQRVRGAHGHLSNAQSAELVSNAATGRLKHLVLAHLSQDNNHPDLALEAAQAGLHGAKTTGVTVEVALQQIALSPMALQTPLDFRPTKPKPRKRKKAPVIAADDSGQQVSLF